MLLLLLLALRLSTSFDCWQATYSISLNIKIISTEEPLSLFTLHTQWHTIVNVFLWESYLTVPVWIVLTALSHLDFNTSSLGWLVSGSVVANQLLVLASGSGTPSRFTSVLSFTGAFPAVEQWPQTWSLSPSKAMGMPHHGQATLSFPSQL